MKNILCFLVIAALAAQICARPDSKDDAAKAAKDEAEKAKKAGDPVTDAAKKLENAAKKEEKQAEDVVSDCEKPVEEAAEKVMPKPHHKKHGHGIVSGIASGIQAVGDTVLGFFEALRF